ncbi:MAG: hypothetical protein CVV11_05280 [Gammaproteobacteria bacterium HGW-Gammaproteobacteria-15]|nr:MAG: hypothetical protein CVV11_05280 [Gammaproteobacteria bacterium HGW-Gammaproteobacteria-15]
MFILLVILSTLPATTEPIIIRGGTVESFPVLQLQNNKIVPEHEFGYKEVTDCIEQQLNIDIQWQAMPTNRLLKMLAENELDIGFSMGFTEQRSAYLQPSSYVKIDHDYFLFKGNSLNLDDKQLSIAVKRGSPQQDHLARQGYNNIYPVSDYNELIPLLLNHRVNAVSLPFSLIASVQPSIEQHQLLLKRHHSRGTGFYLSPAFASQYLPALNTAILQCRQHALPNTTEPL